MKRRGAPFWRNWFASWTVFTVAVTVFTSVNHEWLLVGLDSGVLTVDAIYWRYWHNRIPPREAIDEQGQRLTRLERKVAPTRHDLCLAEISRLERELAADGVLFLLSDREFDEKIEQITHPISQRNEPYCEEIHDDEWGRKVAAEIWRKHLR